MPIVVIDPGHGGTQTVGGSRPNNATGPAGTLEKDLTLDLAGRARDALAPCGVEVQMTRIEDENLGLAQRAAVAKDLSADVFLSIHFNAAVHKDGTPDPAVNGTETWVFTDASQQCRDLAALVQVEAVHATGLRDRGVRRMRLGVLDPLRHAADTAACLVEVSFLTNPDEELRLGGSDYLDRIATALATAIASYLEISCVAPVAEASSAAREPRRLSRSPSLQERTLSHHSQRFDIWHEVPLVPQLTGMSCWAAAAAMIIGWRDRIDIDPGEVARGSGRWADYRDGLDPQDVDTLASAWGLVAAPAGSVTTDELRRLLEQNGPLWVGEASPDLHVVVVAGLYGDGTPEGTQVRVLDPWPEGRGERYVLTAHELLTGLRAAEELSGEPTRILHAGGRTRRSARSALEAREELHATLSYRIGSHAEAYPRRRYGTPYGLLHRYRSPGPAMPIAAIAEAPPRDVAEEDVATLPDDTDSVSPAVPDEFGDEPAQPDDRDWYEPEDLEPTPSAQALLARTDAAYAEDRLNVDLRHLGHAGSSLPFDLSGDLLLELFRLNRFNVEAGQDEVLFGLRGCSIVEGPEGRFADSVQLVEDIPDHYGFHCVIGVYRRSTGQLAVLSGSTVPNWALMEQQRVKKEQVANLLPTGRYLYTVGRHRAVTGAFILSGEVVVLRSNDDLVYEVTDLWERHTPGDNIHPSFSPKQALFSSAGCQTVPGRWSANGGHSGKWAEFRAAAGLAQDDKSRWGSTYVYCLLTGREARLVSELGDSIDLTRLRFGSQGAVVQSLQEALTRSGHYQGSVDGDMGPGTVLAYIKWQQGRDAAAADGIVSSTAATVLGVSLR